MKYYFLLQYRRLDRKIRELGVPPWIGFVIGALLFVGASKYLYVKTEFANWIYAFFGLSAVVTMGNNQRNDQLHAIFQKQDYLRIRLIENTLAALPFAIYLLYEGDFRFAFGLCLLGVVSAFINFRFRSYLALPTPFRSFPYEFIAGFRRTFWLILLSYFLVAKAIQVDNFNLGLFALALLFFNGMSYYAQPEDEYFVWIYATDAAGFIRRKLRIALICGSILTAPICITLLFLFPERIWLVLGLQLLGTIFLLSMILAKYSAYPREISLPQAFLYGLSLWFPPMLLIVLPIFYRRSRKQLKSLLE